MTCTSTRKKSSRSKLNVEIIGFSCGVLLGGYSSSRGAERAGAAVLMAAVRVNAGLFE
jgi:hypothetical protein